MMNRITNNKVQNCKPQCKIGKLELLSFDQSYEHDPELAGQLVGSCYNHQLSTKRISHELMAPLQVRRLLTINMNTCQSLS